MCLAASLLPSVVNFLMLPVYTRFLSPADYGLVAVVTTVVSFVAAFMGLQMVNSISRLYFDYDGSDRVRYISTVYFGTLFVNVSLFLLFQLAGDPIVRFLFPGGSLSYRPYVQVGLVALLFTTQINFCNSLFRVQERGS